MIHPADLFRLPKDFKPYPIQLLFYLLFADHHEVWASHKRLARILGFSSRTVIRSVAHLECLGILSVKRFPGSREVNRYTLNEEVLSRLLSQVCAASDSLEEPVPMDSTCTASEGCSLAPDAVQVPTEASPVSQENSPGLAEEQDITSSESVVDLVDESDNHSESFFDDPRLDLLVRQVEERRKDGTLLFRWLKSQNLLLYWPPSDSYRVDKQRLRGIVKTLDDLNATLNAPVRPEYVWFVEEFLQGCRDNHYDVEDNSETLATEINIFLDSRLKNQSSDGKSLWTASSLKNQLQMMLEEWERLPTWKQLRLPIEPPQEPTLQFFLTNPIVWEAAREKHVEEKEEKMLNFLDRLASGGKDLSSDSREAAR